MKKYIMHIIGILLIFSLLFPFVYVADSDNYSIILLSGWKYFSQNLFSLSSILIFLALIFINYQGYKNSQLIVFVMTSMVALYFYCSPILSLGEEFWSSITEFPVGYFISGLLMIAGIGLNLKRLVSG
ncbi:TPA: hypothetical protein ACGO3I_000881 [Streptococcus suis]